jgi:membrane fusion protein (multidrug efflux system)
MRETKSSSQTPGDPAAPKGVSGPPPVPDPADSPEPAPPTKPPHRSGIRGGIIAGVMVLLALLFVVGVATIPKHDEKEPNQQTPAVNVTVLPIEPIVDFKDTFTTPGSIEPNSVVRVAAEVPGRIEYVTLLEGKEIKAGMKLAELNTDLLQAAADQAKATKEFDARELERVKTLLDRGNATPMEYDQALAKADVSKAAYNATKAQLDRAVIFAPAGGRLDKVPVEAGEYVAPGQVIAEIVETDPAVVVVEVPERDMRYIRLGQTETILVDALGGKEFTGTIRFISAIADTASRTTRVELAVPNPDGELRAGQIVTVHMLRRVIPEVILIPLEAAISLERSYRVYVVEDGKAQPRDVKIGLLKGRDVQVITGLSAGDELIVRGHYYVGPGQAVEVIGRGDQIEPTSRAATGPAEEDRR